MLGLGENLRGMAHPYMRLLCNRFMVSNRKTAVNKTKNAASLLSSKPLLKFWKGLNGERECQGESSAAAPMSASHKPISTANAPMAAMMGCVVSAETYSPSAI